VNIWYRVSDLDAACAFYREQLGFQQVYLDAEDRWMKLARDGVELVIAEAEPAEGEEPLVAAVDVPDVKAEAERLRAAGVEVGVVLEIPGTIRLLDVFDPDGNRLQLTQEL
jgi:predicted enzyme related to lactoylglutathione lyase